MEINLAQIIFQMVNFGMVLAALTYLIYKPVLKLLEDRRTRVADAAEAAAAVMKEKENLEKVKEKTLSEASVKAKKMEDEIRREAKADAKLLLEESKSEISAKEVKFSSELAKLKKEELKSMESEVKKAALTIAEKVLGSSIDAKKHQKLIDDQINEIIESL